MSHRSHVAALQVFDLDHAVRIFAFDEPRGIHRIVLSVAVSARRAVYPNFELSAQSREPSSVLRKQANETLSGCAISL